MKCNTMYKNVELRKLPVGSLCTVAAILETNNDWKKVMSLIPRNPRSEYFEPKYNSEHIKQIEDAARASNKKCAELLLDEWSTSGRIRPTLGTLKDVVQKAEIFRAADEIALMLEESPPTRPQDGPAAPIDTSITALIELTNTTHMNDTTAQVRSENPHPKSLGQKTTAQMKTTSGPNIPNFSILNVKTQNNIDEADPQVGNGYQTSLPNIDFASTNSVQNVSGIATEILEDEKLIHFEYKELEKITKRFFERLSYTPDPGQGKLAGKIGSGGFGDVFVGWHSKYGHIAIKKARLNSEYERKPEIFLKLFNSEVKSLSRFRHENIVPIIGYSKDGPSLCIVCEFIPGGSLEQKLTEKSLTERQRLNILLGTAEGLKYLHTSEKFDKGDRSPLYSLVDSDCNSKKENFVHGDVKSANILLTRECVPKLCDFGLAKQFESTFLDTSPVGTLAYMAPEGLTGTITQKNDIYSYGVVMLEVLTGLKPIVKCHNGDKINIKDHVEDHCPTNDITKLLDPFIDKWTKAKEIFELARNCLERQRKMRPTAEEICERLYQIMGMEKTES